MRFNVDGTASEMLAAVSSLVKVRENLVSDVTEFKFLFFFFFLQLLKVSQSNKVLFCHLTLSKRMHFLAALG